MENISNAMSQLHFLHSKKEDHVFSLFKMCGLSFSYWFMRNIYTCCKISLCHLCDYECLLLHCVLSFQSLYGVFQWIDVPTIKEIIFMLYLCFLLFWVQENFSPIEGIKRLSIFWSFELVITKLSRNDFYLWCRMHIPFHFSHVENCFSPQHWLLNRLIIFLIICLPSVYVVGFLICIGLFLFGFSGRFF